MTLDGTTSVNRMILCCKLKNGPSKIVTKSQVVIKYNVTKTGGKR